MPLLTNNHHFLSIQEIAKGLLVGVFVVGAAVVFLCLAAVATSAESARETCYNTSNRPAYLPAQTHELAACTKVIRENPRDYRALYNRGVFYLRTTDLYRGREIDKAIADFSSAIRLNPDYLEAYQDRGTAWYFKDNYERAADDYGAMIRLRPNAAIGYNSRGQAWLAMNKLEKALSDFDQAIRVEPSFDFAYYYRGTTWEKMNNLQKALADFKKFSELNPRYPDGIKALERVTKALQSDIPATPIARPVKPAAPVQTTVNSAGTSPGDSCAIASDHWKSVEAIATAAAYEDHLARFPSCAFAGLAKLRIDQLKTK